MDFEIIWDGAISGPHRGLLNTPAYPVQQGTVSEPTGASLPLRWRVAACLWDWKTPLEVAAELQVEAKCVRDTMDWMRKVGRLDAQPTNHPQRKAYRVKRQRAA